MVWPDQDPPTTDVLLYVNVPCAGGGSPAYRKIDKLPDSRYRAIVGTLFEHPEICRTGDLDALVRYGNAMASRSFDEVLAFPGKCVTPDRVYSAASPTSFTFQFSIPDVNKGGIQRCLLALF
jgi:hypothetical protein